MNFTATVVNARQVKLFLLLGGVNVFLKVVKVLSIVIISSLMLIGCGQSMVSDSQANLTNIGGEKKFTIVTSFYPMYVSTINITKGVPNVQVKNMTKPETGCLHDYQLSPEDLKILEKADAFVVNGAGMEVFLDKVIQQQTQLKVVDGSKGIVLLKDDNGEENPHVWVSISNAIIQVENIAQQLSSLDAAHADIYKSNADDYIKKLSALKDTMHTSLDSTPNKNIITFHEAFPYFAKEFNLNIVAVIEREPGAEPSPRELEDTIQKIKDSNIKALFAELQYPSKAADVISQETGAKVYMLDPGVIGDAKSDAYNDYINMMEKNLETLQEALK